MEEEQKIKQNTRKPWNAMKQNDRKTVRKAKKKKRNNKKKSTEKKKKNLVFFSSVGCSYFVCSLHGIHAYSSLFTSCVRIFVNASHHPKQKKNIKWCNGIHANGQIHELEHRVHVSLNGRSLNFCLNSFNMQFSSWSISLKFLMCNMYLCITLYNLIVNCKS